jgi:Lecithin retinol acyltransferase
LIESYGVFLNLEIYNMSFELVESSVLRIHKIGINELAGLADHYFLSEFNNIDNSVGWMPNGLDLRGKVRITLQEIERVEKFMAVAQYNISLNNCEHFANYVLYGLNFSSQQYVWWKNLGSSAVSFLQPTQSENENYQKYMNNQISDVLNENLRQAKIDRANLDRIDFWNERAAEIK